MFFYWYNNIKMYKEIENQLLMPDKFSSNTKVNHKYIKGYIHIYIYPFFLTGGLIHGNWKP